MKSIRSLSWLSRLRNIDFLLRIIWHSLITIRSSWWNVWSRLRNPRKFSDRLVSGVVRISLIESGGFRGLYIVAEILSRLALWSWSNNSDIRGNITIVTSNGSIRLGIWKNRLFLDPVGAIASIKLVLLRILDKIFCWLYWNLALGLSISRRTLFKLVFFNWFNRISRWRWKLYSNDDSLRLLAWSIVVKSWNPQSRS